MRDLCFPQPEEGEQDTRPEIPHLLDFPLCAYVVALDRRVPHDANGTPVGSEIEHLLLRHGIRDQGQLWTLEDLIFDLAGEVSRVNAERMEDLRDGAKGDGEGADGF